VSLVIAASGYFEEAQHEEVFAQAAYEFARGMRIAGGSVLPSIGPRIARPQWIPWPGIQAERRKAFARLCRRLLPGFALIHRPDLLHERLSELQANEPNASALDALLDLTRLNHHPVPPQDGTTTETGKVEWQLDRRPGWLVPLPIGYAGISPLHAPGEVAGARDATTPFRFVESLYSLGQWIGPHRLGQLDQLLWHGTAEPATGLYRCENRYADLTETEPNTLQGA
jgi:CRISPR-associated protein Csy2